MGLIVSETWIDRSRNLMCGESGEYEAFTDDPGTLYRNCVREYGRCTGKVYIDVKNAPPKAVGWVFLKRRKYDDARPQGGPSNDTYLAETWVTLRTAKTTVTRTPHYRDLAS